MSSDVEYVFACSTAKACNAALHSVLITEGKKHTFSTYFLCRLVDFPDFDTAVMAMLVNSMFDHQPIIDLESTTSKICSDSLSYLQTANKLPSCANKQATPEHLRKCAVSTKHTSQRCTRPSSTTQQSFPPTPSCPTLPMFVPILRQHT